MPIGKRNIANRPWAQPVRRPNERKPALKKVKSATQRPPWNDNQTDQSVFHATPEELRRRRESHISKHAVLARVQLQDQGKRSPSSERKLHTAVLKEMLQKQQQDIDDILARSCQTIDLSHKMLNEASGSKTGKMKMISTPDEEPGSTLSTEGECIVRQRAINDIDDCLEKEDLINARSIPLNKVAEGNAGTEHENASSGPDEAPVKDHAMNDTAKIRQLRKEADENLSPSKYKKHPLNMSRLQQALCELKDEVNSDTIVNSRGKNDALVADSSPFISSFTEDLIHTINRVSKNYRKLRQELANEQELSRKLQREVAIHEKLMSDIAEELLAVQSQQVALVHQLSRQMSTVAESTPSAQYDNLSELQELQFNRQNTLQTSCSDLEVIRTPVQQSTVDTSNPQQISDFGNRKYYCRDHRQHIHGKENTPSLPRSKDTQQTGLPVTSSKVKNFNKTGSVAQTESSPSPPFMMLLPPQQYDRGVVGESALAQPLFTLENGRTKDWYLNRQT